MSRLVPALRVVLCLYLLTWEPLNVATEALQAWPTLDARGGWAVAELVFHVLVAMFTVAAGVALWIRSPHGPVLGVAGVLAASARAEQIRRYSWLPHDIAPSVLTSGIALAHACFWIAFLIRYQDRLTQGPVPDHLRLDRQA